MAYKPLNSGLPNKRESAISKRIAKQKVLEGERFEKQRGIYGNIHTIIDHDRKVYYRQDMDIVEQLDLLESPLPRYCDYCQKEVKRVTQVQYTAVYEMIVRPKTNPEVKRDKQEIIFAACRDCEVKEIVPKTIIKGYITELYRDGKKVWEKPFLHYDGKIRMPYTSI